MANKRNRESDLYHYYVYTIIHIIFNILYLSAKFFNIIISNIHSWPCKDTQKPELLEVDQSQQGIALHSS